MRSVAARVADALLWITAALGAAAIVATAALWATGARPVVVQSGSMTPTYDVRSLVLVHRLDPGDVRVGDVVLLDPPGGGRVLHRVIDVDRTAAGTSVRTKGDANPEPDVERTVLARGATAWRAGASFPLLGGAAALLRTPAAGFLLAVALLGPLAAARDRRPRVLAAGAAQRV